MQENKTLNFSVESFIYYHSTKIALLVGKTAKPLISNNKVFLNEGEICKVKAKLDILDLEQLARSDSVDLSIVGSYEEKLVRGAPVKQFSADKVNKYNENGDRKITSF